VCVSLELVSELQHHTIIIQWPGKKTMHLLYILSTAILMASLTVHAKLDKKEVKELIQLLTEKKQNKRGIGMDYLRQIYIPKMQDYYDSLPCNDMCKKIDGNQVFNLVGVLGGDDIQEEITMPETLRQTIEHNVGDIIVTCKYICDPLEPYLLHLRDFANCSEETPCVAVGQ